MRAHLVADGGMMLAEALSFALAAGMPRPEAQAAVKALAKQSKVQERSLLDLARERWPEMDFASLLAPEAQLGQAPAEAEAFARVAKTV